MLQTLNGCSAQPDALDDLARMAAMLDLDAAQMAPWREFAEMIDEARAAIEAIDAVTDYKFGDRIPPIAEALDMQARCFAVRLGATRELMNAAAKLQDALKPRQRACADRLLTVLCKGTLRAAR